MIRRILIVAVLILSMMVVRLILGVVYGLCLWAAELVSSSSKETIAAGMFTIVGIAIVYLCVRVVDSRDIKQEAVNEK